MNSTISNKTVSTDTEVTTGHQQHPPQQVQHQLHVVRRLTWLDRAALHLGVALIRWGRRPAARDDRDHHAAELAYRAARRERERAMERMLLLHARRW
ncbi:hypothetical protein BH09ACT1_BH09ACT1_18900 [soil metagenome]